MSSLPDWLGALGLAQYTQIFVDNDIDFAVLAGLSEQDLEHLGVSSMGHRKRLLAAIAQLPRAASAADTGERRQLTVLFCDMVGFTELASRLDPEVLQDVVRIYEDACAACITRYDGYVFQRLGDGIVAFFGYPLAHEGEAERAVRAALAIVAGFAGLEVADVGRLAVRIGIATGVVVVAPAGKGAVGETMNLASRLQSIAPVNAVVVSERVRRHAGGNFVYRSLGEQMLKGIRAPTMAYAVVGPSAAASRFEAATQRSLTPIVGREQEIGLLLDRWQQARGGDGQVVLLSGEPGIGKSRILGALCERLEGDGAHALRFQCSPYHSTSALHPAIDNFERALKFARDETPQARLDKLEALICGHYGRPAGDVVYVAAMLSIPFEARYGRVQLSPQRFKSETLRCLVDVAEAAARMRPSVVLFEDVHWADPTTVEMLDLLIDRARSFALLIVLTHRAEFESRWGHGHVATIELSKLTRAQSRAIVDKLTDGKALPAELLEQILTKTDGVPLFVEELTQSILESGELRDAGDHFDYAGAPQSVHIPASLRDSLMARLDRHAPVKEIAQIGAVIGREFSYELIQALAPRSQAELDLALARLTDSGLASRRGTPPEASYTFKHALVQDVAYDSLLKSRRQELHARIARVLEQSFPARKDAEPELLARHFGAAGMAQPAIAYGLEAAKRAVARSAYREALAQLDACAALLERLPDGRERTLAQLRLQLQRAGALLATKSYSAPQTGSAWAAARRLCDQLGEDVEETSSALFGFALFQFTCGQMREAEATARELLRRALAAHGPALLLPAYRMLGTLHFYRGALQEAADDLAHAVAVYDPVRDRQSSSLAGADQKASSLAYRSLALHLLGHPDQALAANREAIEHARSLGHVLGIAGITWFVVHLAVHRREAARALEQAERAMALAQQHGFPLWHEIAKCGAGIAIAQLGEPERGSELIGQWLDRSKAMGYGAIRGWALASAASAKAAAGQWQAAASLFAEAAAQVQATDERWFEAEVHRLEGEFVLARDGAAGAAQAEACFERALRVARGQRARMWELRAAVDLARLWQGQGRRAQAFALLDPVYRGFTEGFDLLDLQQAGSLLGELAT